jgi:hypothetical protein
MGKRATPIQKLVAFAMEVTEVELNNVVEVVAAIRSSRFPKAKKATQRKPRSDKGTQRAKDESKPNGGAEAGGE